LIQTRLHSTRRDERAKGKKNANTNVNVNKVQFRSVRQSVQSSQLVNPVRVNFWVVGQLPAFTDSQWRINKLFTRDLNDLTVCFTAQMIMLLRVILSCSPQKSE